MNQPADRTFIGEIPDQIKRVNTNSTKYIQSLLLEKKPDAPPDEPWFPTQPVEFNSGLVVVLGNKGSGKSALADILGLAGNTQRKTEEFSFLNPTKFAKPNPNRASWFDATLKWRDEKVTTCSLDDFGRKSSEKVLYVPQHFFEKICNETEITAGGAFDLELKKVIFSHVPLEQRLQKESFNELIDYLKAETEQAILHQKTLLTQINQSIVNLEGMQTDKYRQNLESELDEKKAELDANTEPLPVKSPEANTDTSAKIQTLREDRVRKIVQIQQVQSQIAEQNTLLASVNRLQKALENFRTKFTDFRNENREIVSSLGLDIETLISLTIDLSPIESAQSQAQENISNFLIEKSGLESSVEQIDAKIEDLQGMLDEEELEYQEFLDRYDLWKKRRDEIVGDETRFC